MYRRTFLEYLMKHDISFMEMAQIRQEERLKFGDDDQEYLKQFQPPSLELWKKAIMYRYSPAVLKHPEQEMHKVTIDKKTFEVNVYPQELIKRILDQDYDPDKIDLSFRKGNDKRLVAEQAAKKELAIYLGKPEYAINKATPIDISKAPKDAVDYVKKNYSSEIKEITKSKAEKDGKYVDVFKFLLDGNIYVIFDKKGNHIKDEKREPARGAFSLPQAKSTQFELSPKYPEHYARSGDRTKSIHTRPERTITHSPIITEPIKLDQDDINFINWFRSKNLNVVNKHGELINSLPAKKFLYRAFMMRYNGELTKDVSDQGKHEKQVEFNVGKGAKAIANIPIDFDHLRKKLKKLADNGVDFNLVPLTRESAERWIESGSYKPHLGTYGKGETNKETGNKRMETIKRYEDEQYKHLSNPNFPSPNHRDESNLKLNGRDFEYEVPWLKILEQEAEIAAIRAINKASSYRSDAKEKFRRDSDDYGELKQKIWIYLSKEDIVNSPKYPSQNWRIYKATNFGWDQIKKSLRHNFKSIDASKDATGDEIKAKPEEPSDDISTKSKTSDDISNANDVAIPPALEPVVNFLKQVKPQADSLPPDVDWINLSNRYLQMCKSYMIDNKKTELNRMERIRIAKDLLSSEIPAPAIAAEKTPAIAKIDPATKQTDNQKGFGFGGIYNNDDGEADPEEIKKYRSRPRFGN